MPVVRMVRMTIDDGGVGGGAPPLSGPPAALKPGVIPLRPLTLSDIFNAAFAYVRINPMATLGLTTIVAIITQVNVLAVASVTTWLVTGETAALGRYGVGRAEIVSEVVTLLSLIVLTGMLTVVVGRAVFGATTTIGEAWARLRGRLLALFGLILLGVTALAAVVTICVVAIIFSTAANPALGALLGMVVGPGLFVVLVYVGTLLSLAPPALVLERLSVLGSMRRSFALVRRSFWRVFGIVLLAAVVAVVLAFAVARPFDFVGQVLESAGDKSAAWSLAGSAVLAVGTVIAQIITAPFMAGVVVLLYADRRMRAEAFDLMLQTGMVVGPELRTDSPDDLWLIRHP